MSALHDILTWPARLRRSRGFGVHSPFAFDLITRTIRERDAYYAYDTLCTSAGRRFGQMALIVRLICRFQPTRVTLTGHDSLVESTIALADSRLAAGKTLRYAPSADTERVEALHLPMVIITAPTGKAAAQIPQGDYVVIACDITSEAGHKQWQRLLQHRSAVAFTSRHTGIVCYLDKHQPAIYNLL